MPIVWRKHFFLRFLIPAPTQRKIEKYALHDDATGDFSRAFMAIHRISPTIHMTSQKK